MCLAAHIKSLPGLGSVWRIDLPEIELDKGESDHDEEAFWEFVEACGDGATLLEKSDGSFYDVAFAIALSIQRSGVGMGKFVFAVRDDGRDGAFCEPAADAGRYSPCRLADGSAHGLARTGVRAAVRRSSYRAC